MICSKEAMKDILVLLVLLSARTTKVCSLPYQADSDGNCHNSTTEYLSEDLNLCCKRCPPGQRLVQECSKTTETVCQGCGPNQYLEKWNYNENCFSCNKCKSTKGLQYAQTCSPTTKARCVCQPGKFCLVGYEKPYYCTTECKQYRRCGPGWGVSVEGTANSDVKCEPCPDGTFSDTNSHTDRCRPHTNCHGKAAVTKGNATSDTVCELGGIIAPPLQNTSQERDAAASSTMRSMVSATSDSTLPVSQHVFNYSTKSPPLVTDPDINPAIIAGVTGGILFVIIAVITLVFLHKTAWRTSENFHPKVDANGNCESGDKINPGYLGETQLTSFTVSSPEQQCLLEKVEVSSDHSQFSNNTETLTKTDSSSNYESIGPLQSTVALDSSCSALSEPMILISNTEPVTPQPSIPSQSSSQSSSQCSSQSSSQSSSQPTVTTSPHVNVSITFHIGNGSCGTPSVMPTNLKEADSELQYGEEEESFSIPQQEDGKQSIMSVQDSATIGV